MTYRSHSTTNKPLKISSVDNKIFGEINLNMTVLIYNKHNQVMFSIPTLKLDSGFNGEGLGDGAGSHREAYSRKQSIDNTDSYSKICGLSLNTGISSVGALTDRNREDFAPVTMEHLEQYLPDMMGEEDERYKNMYSEIKWMLDGEGRGKSKGIWRNEKRDLVVNWVALVHIKYRFDQETFHRAISIIDKYLTADNLADDYQLLAVTAFWMAAKVEERKVREVKSWAKLGRTFSVEKILEMESRILEVMNYNIIHPTSEMFLREFLVNYIQLDERSEVLCMYLLELGLMEKSYTLFKDSILAASSVYLCFKIRRMNIQFLDKQLSGFVSSNYNDIRECAKMLCKSFQKVKPKSPIYRKFSSKRYLHIALIEIGKKGEEQYQQHPIL